MINKGHYINQTLKNKVFLVHKYRKNIEHLYHSIVKILFCYDEQLCKELKRGLKCKGFIVCTRLDDIYKNA